MAAIYRLSLWRRVVNALVMALLRWGFGPRHTYLLTVRGRKSGRLCSTPVTLVEQHGQRWLVALLRRDAGVAPGHLRRRGAARSGLFHRSLLPVTVSGAPWGASTIHQFQIVSLAGQGKT